MSAHVLLDLLNELRKSEQMQGLSTILSLFRCEFDKFNDKRARLLDYIYRMTSKSIKKHIFGMKTSRLCHLLRNIIMDVVV